MYQNDRIDRYFVAWGENCKRVYHLFDPIVVKKVIDPCTVTKAAAKINIYIFLFLYHKMPLWLYAFVNLLHRYWCAFGLEEKIIIIHGNVH